jgi:hypothetical protein
MVFECCLGYSPHNLQQIKQGKKKINIGIKNQKKNWGYLTFHLSLP